jgi:hypothetical protein
MVASIMHLLEQSLQFCKDFDLCLRTVFIISHKCMHLIIHFNPGATGLFLHIPLVSLPSNILAEIPVTSSSIDDV